MCAQLYSHSIAGGENMPKLEKLLMGVAVIAALSLGGCKAWQAEYGTLEGMVSIGPLCPVERIPPDPSCLPTEETYEAWPISVYRNNLAFRQLEPIPPDGIYSIELPAGKYVVDLNNYRGIGSDNLPQEITILPGEATALDIEIDTGMR